MNRFRIFVAIALLAIGSSVAAEPLSPAAFRDRLAAAVSGHTKKPSTTVDERTFKNVSSDGSDLTISIDNAYADYLAHEDRLETILARFVASLDEGEAGGSEPLDQLVVIVRPSNYLQRSLPEGASLENFLPSRPMAGDVSFYLAVDAPNSIRTVGPSDLKRWGIDEAQAWRTGVKNIKARIGPLGVIHLGDESGASGLAADSGLAPSILADATLCSPEHPDGMNSQIVLVYARDMFLFAVQ